MEKQLLNHFVIKAKLPSLNDYTDACRSGKHSGANHKKDTEQLICAYIRISKTIHPVDTPVEVHFEWHEGDRRRDVDNIIFAKKYILDSLQKCKIIPNDSRRYVKQCYDKVYDDTDTFVVVSLIEVGDCDE